VARNLQRLWFGTAMSTSMGMVQVRGNTYRIARVTPGTYEAIRLIDDLRVGTFSSRPPMRLVAEACDAQLLLEIAHAALRQAKTSCATNLTSLRGGLGPMVVRASVADVK
jgi:hypothetical protein